MNHTQLTAAIGNTLLLQVLPEFMREKFIELILSASAEVDIGPGDILFRAGEPDVDRGYICLEGALRVTRADGTVRYIEAPDILGEVQLFSPGAKRTATVEAVFGGAALEFEWRDLGAMAKDTFGKDELRELRDAIAHSASMREKNLLESLDSR